MKVVKLGDYIKEYSEKNTGKEKVPVYSVTNEEGFCRGYFSKDVSSRDKSNYKIVPYGYFAYNPSRINVGSIDWQKAENKVLVSPLYVVFQVKKGIEQQYLLHYLKSDIAKSYIKFMANGSVRDNLKFSALKNFSINLPSVEEQKNIVKKIDRVDLLYKRLKQLENKYDELIKSRFVELFGDPIKNPKGWEVVAIGDVVTEVRYGTSKPAVEGGRYPYLRMNNLTVDGHLDLNDLKYIDISDDEIEKCVVRKGDVLFNRTNSVELVGKTAVFDLPEDMVIAGYIIRVRLNERLLPEVLSEYMNLEALKAILRSMAKGAVNQANINAQELQSIKVYLPDMELQLQFLDFFNQTDKSKLAVKKSLEKLEILKKSLMQQYFG
ncbi:MAG: type I restriction endonuclease subunit S [Lachnospiraceae bacterium]|nr:type I restriction endonuclease subunit S [Lachnospiraceae bacterium]